MAKKTDSVLLSLVNDRKAAAERYREPHVIPWLKKLFIYLDEILEYSSITKRWERTYDNSEISETNEDIEVPYVPVNIAYSKYHQIKSTFYSLPLNMKCSTEKKEPFITGARVSTSVLNTFVKPKFENLKDDMLFWMFWACRPVIKIWWDAKAGRIIQVPKYTDMPAEGDLPINLMKNDKELLVDGKPIQAILGGKPLFHKHKDGEPQYEDVNVGDLKLTVLSPFEYLIDPSARTKDALFKDSDCRAQWIIHYKNMSEIQAQKEGMDTSGVNWDTMPTTQIDTILSQINKLEVMDPKTKHAKYMEYWQLPDKDYPNGLFLKILGDKIQSENDLPSEWLKLDILPFVDVAEDYPPISWYSKTMMDKISDLQRAYSEENSIMLSLAKKIGRVRVLMQGRGKINVIPVANDELIDEIVQIPAGSQPPQLIQWNDIPMAILRHLDWLLRDIELVSGVHDIRYPINKDRKAAEVYQTIEQDEKRVNVLLRNISERLAYVAKISLCVIAENFLPTVEYTLLDEFGRSEKMAFKQSWFDIDHKVEVDFANNNFKSVSGNLLLVETLVKLGVLQDPEKVLTMLNMGEGLGDETSQIHRKVQMDENLGLLESNKETPEDMPSIKPWHNDGIHIKVLEEFLNKYENSLSAAQQTKANDHLGEHKKRALEAMMAQQQMMAPQPNPQKGKQNA